MSTGHHFSLHAAQHGGSPACITAKSGETLSYAGLEATTNQTAQLFRNLGLSKGDSIVLFCENSTRFYEIIWGAHRAGLYYTPISWHATAHEIAYIIENAQASAFIASNRFSQAARKTLELLNLDVLALSLFDEIEGFESLESKRSAESISPIGDETSGREMMYTSGTTGRPKGVKFPLDGSPIDKAPQDDLFLMGEGYGPNARVMAPGPLYHASPLMSTRAMHRFGGAVVIIDKFDAMEMLEYIERYQVTHIICVPTHFARLLDIDKEVRSRFDVSSVQCIMHTGAPCPVSTKRAMIEWFGPVIIEYYGGTERIGGAMIRSQEWLEHPGSIGKVAVGSAYAVDEETWEVLAPNEIGVIYFDGGEKFEYHGDADKTKGIHSPQGWRTLGDVGRIDEDGYIYLTDRKSNMIITGGVNVYPQEAEQRLMEHPLVVDVAVFGIPNDAFGEEVKAAVQLAESAESSTKLSDELIDFCKEVLAPVKCPRTIDFEEQLPREANGKLYKKKLIERYRR